RPKSRARRWDGHGHTLHQRPRRGDPSPPGAGRKAAWARVDVEVGLLPACAGSRGSPRARAGSARVHPRMRGEQYSHVASDGDGAGSSPHARGAAQLVAGGTAPVGFIPACAGSSRTSQPTGTGSRVHPRMRGEQFRPPVPDEIAQGSSPHARGAAVRRARLAGVDGFIPACAGSRESSKLRMSRSGVHPRMRGEQTS
ncbi:conserved hypothetical protein, partial [Streptomyces sp. Mg1]